MQQLTEHEKKILELVKKHPEIVDDRSAREKVANEVGISEKTLRNRIADLKRFGLIDTSRKVKKNRLGSDVSLKMEINRKNKNQSKSDFFSQERKSASFIDYLYVIAKRRKFIIVNFIVVCAFASTYSLIMPKTYTATAVVLPESTIEGRGYTDLSSNLAFGNLSGLLGGTSNEALMFVAILKSRTIKENAIRKFDLQSRYRAENIDDTIQRLNESVTVSLEEEGTVSVKVSSLTKYLHTEDDEIEARELCANIANFLISELDRIYVRFQTQQAMHNRIFIESKYEEAKRNLEQTEERLRKFQEEYGIISLNDQLSAAVSAVADIQSRIAVAEIELELLKSSLSSDNVKINQKEIELEQLRNWSREMMVGSGDKDSSTVFLSFSDTPDLNIKFIRLQRELEVQGLILRFLTEQYEQARIQEKKDTPITQILDKARTPIKRSKPRRKLLVMLAGIMSIILSVVYVYSAEYVQDMMTEDKSKYQKFLYLTNIIPFIKIKQSGFDKS